VSVPVLSKTTVVTWLAYSRTSARLMIIPREAAIPVPTITAVGVARPSAQGHAMTSVEMPKFRAKTKRFSTLLGRFKLNKPR